MYTLIARINCFLCLGMMSLILSSIYSAPSLGNEQPIRILTMQTPPYGFLDENDSEAGILHELNHLIIDESGLKAEIVMKPLARMTRDLQQGAADCTILAGVRNVTETYQLVAQLRKSIHMGIIPRKGTEIKSYDDLSELKIAVPLGILLNDEFDGDEDLNKVQIRNYQDGLNLLAHGRIDALAGLIETLNYLVSQQIKDHQNYFGTPYIMAKYGVYFVCRKDYRDEIKLNKVRQAIDRLHEAGKIEALVSQYLD